jgi:hypothetical protein
VSLVEIVRIEAALERSGSRSALVEPISGAATYPSIVQPESNYQDLVATVAHEWVHQYLFFKPLGRRFYESLELRTLNETVATLAGEEIALLTVLRDPLEGAYARSPVDSLTPAVDVSATLRALRLDIEALLAFGQVDRAETLMEERRRELASQGIAFRRINQAFFAFRSVYGSSPASIDPIGDKVATLRQRAGSVGEFLRRAGELTAERDLERELRDRLTSVDDTER